MTNYKRIKNDYYPTEEKITEVLLKHWVIHKNKTNVLEPCAGKRHISKVLESNGFSVTSTDIEDCNYPDTIEHYPNFYDATLESYWQREAICNGQLIYDYIITNPPYNKADEIVPLAYKYANYGIAMLLRLSWLEPTKKRAKFLQDNPPDSVIILNPRPKFRSDTKGTDSVTSAWFIWNKEDSLVPIKPFIFETDWK